MVYPLYPCVLVQQVSAVTREGFDDLLETLLLQAEVLELRADDKVKKQATQKTIHLIVRSNGRHLINDAYA